MGIGNARRAPRFISAGSEEELQKKMLELQLSLHLELKWLTIYKNGKSVYAWYFFENETKDILKELG